MHRKMLFEAFLCEETSLAFGTGVFRRVDWRVEVLGEGVDVVEALFALLALKGGEVVWEERSMVLEGCGAGRGPAGVDG